MKFLSQPQLKYSWRQLVQMFANEIILALERGEPEEGEGRGRERNPVTNWKRGEMLYIQSKPLDFTLARQYCVMGAARHC